MKWIKELSMKYEILQLIKEKLWKIIKIKGPNVNFVHRTSTARELTKRITRNLKAFAQQMTLLAERADRL